jgi:hypothetical protein
MAPVGGLKKFLLGIPVQAGDKLREASEILRFAQNDSCVLRD